MRVSAMKRRTSNCSPTTCCTRLPYVVSASSTNTHHEFQC
jgi:hypothetical protein